LSEELFAIRLNEVGIVNGVVVLEELAAVDEGKDELLLDETTADEEGEPLEYRVLDAAINDEKLDELAYLLLEAIADDGDEELEYGALLDAAADDEILA
jgi:hypothetical protein